MTSIALVVLDTLRKDAFEEYFDWLPGCRFDNAWSTSHWTVPAHTSMFTGKPASEVGVVAKSQTLDCADAVLAEELSAAGYTTRGFSSNPNIAPEFQFDRGFSEFTGSWRLNSFEQDHIFDWAHELAQSSLPTPLAYSTALVKCVVSDCNTRQSLRRGIEEKLRKRQIGQYTADDGATATLDYVESTYFGSDEFLFLNLMEAHSPYDPPEEYQSIDPSEYRFDGGLRETITDTDVAADPQRQAYEDSVRYLSDMYEQIFECLEESFDCIVTVSDHGELFGEHGVWRHGYGVYPELVSVPLSVYTKGGEAVHSDELVSLSDLFSAIVDTATTDGVTLPTRLREGDRQTTLTEYHGITHQQKVDRLLEDGYDVDTVDRYEEPLYGLVAESGYGYQTRDGFRGPSSLESTLQSVIDERATRDTTDDRDVSSATEDRLERLGYL